MYIHLPRTGMIRAAHVNLSWVGDRHHLVMEDSRLYVTEMSAPRFPGGPDDMVQSPSGHDSGYLRSRCFFVFVSSSPAGLIGEGPRPLRESRGARQLGDEPVPFGPGPGLPGSGPARPPGPVPADEQASPRSSLLVMAQCISISGGSAPSRHGTGEAM